MNSRPNTKLRSMVYQWGLLLILGIPMPAFATLYEVDVSLTSTVAYDSIDVQLDTSQGSSEVGGDAGDAWCWANTSAGLLGAFNNQPPLLRGTVITLSGIQGPAVLFTCVVDDDSGPPVATEFDVSVNAWSPGTTAPELAISRIEEPE